MLIYYHMDLEMLQFRARCIAGVRSFFSTRAYLETDTGALCPALIPETCLEVFRTDYLEPWRTGADAVRPLYLVPSPEVYLKRLIADHKVSLFQISKCYRNVESVGKIHSPEFTMLEYYTMHADYLDSLALTEALFAHLLTLMPADEAPVSLAPPFRRLTMNDAFITYAGLSLALCPESADLARHAARLELGNETELAGQPWDDLYELILVHAVEPALCRGKPVFLMDYPARVPCLAAERGNGWRTKERWELYVHGVEIANCYTEEREADAVRSYFAEENAVKQATARVPHPQAEDFADVCARMPPCSGVAVGLDRLVMVLAGKTSIDSVLPFPLAKQGRID